MMNFARPNQISNSEIKATHYYVTILLASGAVTIVFLIAIYLASMSPGTAPSELASIAVPP